MLPHTFYSHCSHPHQGLLASTSLLFDSFKYLQQRLEDETFLVIHIQKHIFLVEWIDCSLEVIFGLSRPPSRRSRYVLKCVLPLWELDDASHSLTTPLSFYSFSFMALSLLSPSTHLVVGYLDNISLLNSLVVSFPSASLSTLSLYDLHKTRAPFQVKHSCTSRPFRGPGWMSWDVFRLENSVGLDWVCLILSRLSLYSYWRKLDISPPN